MHYSNEDIAIIRLIRSKGIGLKIFTYLRNSFSNILDALSHMGNYSSVQLASEEEVRKELDELYNKFKGIIITYKSSIYPKSLSLIDDFPPVLSCVGNLDLLRGKNIAIVGSRKASIPFMHFADSLATNLVKLKSVNIVSGLANGIDTYAHKSVCDRAIVVLPHGIGEDVYPANNLKLYKEIVASGGLVVSEFPLYSSPGIISFRQRNRIIAGLSLGVVVVQAAKNSGSLITARYALDYNRQVFAVPGAPMSPLSEGVNKLINDGANIVLSSSDTGSIISNLTPGVVMESASQVLNSDSVSKIDISKKDRELILSLLSHDISVNIEDIVSYTGFSISKTRVALVELSLEARVYINDNDTVLLLRV